jgi:hypothetical protein
MAVSPSALTDLPGIATGACREHRPGSTSAPCYMSETACNDVSVALAPTSSYVAHGSRYTHPFSWTGIAAW